jgi:ribosomal-protein-alanine N-acetyltransferase
VIQFPIETKRLLIRPFALDDAEALHEVWGDSASERFSVAGGRTPPSVEETAKHLAGIVAAHRKHGFASCAVIEKKSGKLIGDCGLFVSSDQPDIELAYGFGRAWWGLGYATEAAAACVRAGFEQLGLERIVADVPAEHAASIRVLEKLGFVLEREERGKRYYAIKRSSGP